MTPVWNSILSLMKDANHPGTKELKALLTIFDFLPIASFWDRLPYKINGVPHFQRPPYPPQVKLFMCLNVANTTVCPIIAAPTGLEQRLHKVYVIPSMSWPQKLDIAFTSCNLMMEWKDVNHATVKDATALYYFVWNEHFIVGRTDQQIPLAGVVLVDDDTSKDNHYDNQEGDQKPAAIEKKSK